MSDSIRLAAGQVTAYDLLNTSSYLVTNFPRQTDMPASVRWTASQPNKMLQQETRASLGRSGGNYYGSYSGELSFFIFTEDMRQYIHETIMSSKPYATVTVYMATVLAGFQVLVGELVNPFAINADSDYKTMGYQITYNNTYLFRRGTILTVSNLLLETGDYLLLETGDKLSLESQ